MNWSGKIYTDTWELGPGKSEKLSTGLQTEIWGLALESGGHGPPKFIRTYGPSARESVENWRSNHRRRHGNFARFSWIAEKNKKWRIHEFFWSGAASSTTAAKLSTGEAQPPATPRRGTRPLPPH